MEKVSIKLRPDNSKAIFEKISETVFHATQHPDFEVQDIIKQQINFFLRDGYSVVLMASNFRKPKVFIANGHTMDSIYKVIQKKLKPLSPTPELYNMKTINLLSLYM